MNHDRKKQISVRLLRKGSGSDPVLHRCSETTGLDHGRRHGKSDVPRLLRWSNARGNDCKERLYQFQKIKIPTITWKSLNLYFFIFSPLFIFRFADFCFSNLNESCESDFFFIELSWEQEFESRAAKKPHYRTGRQKNDKILYTNTEKWFHSFHTERITNDILPC